MGQQLVSHPQVKAVGFTGSIGGGRALYNLAAQRPEPIPVFAEMGSINPVIITQNALESRAEAIATTYAGSVTLGTGQFCTNPGLIIAVESDALTNFISSLGEKTTAIDAQSMLHPNIHRAYENKGAEVIAQEETRLVAAFREDTKDNYAKAKIVTVSGAAFLKNSKLHLNIDAKKEQSTTSVMGI